MEHSIDNKTDRRLWPLVLKMVALVAYVLFGMGPLLQWIFKAVLVRPPSTALDYSNVLLVVLMVPIAGACMAWMVADLCWAAWLWLRKEGA